MSRAGIRASLLSAGIVLATSACPGCSGAFRYPMQGGEVSLWRLSAGDVARHGGREGDFIVASPEIEVVVAAGAAEGSAAGAIVATAPIGHRGVLEQSRVVVHGRSGEIALRLRSVEPEWRTGRPTLRIDEESENGRLLVVTRVELVPGRPQAQLTTVVTNRGDEPIEDLAVGDRILWPGGRTFAPGQGWVESPTRAEAPWIGRQDKIVSAALAFADGPSTVDFQFVPQGTLDSVALGRRSRLDPGASRGYRRHLVTVSGGLERAAAAAWTALGVNLGKIEGTLRPPPSWATVEARDADDRPMLVADAEPSGSFEMLLPEGRYRLVLTAPGGSDTAVVEIARDQPPRAVEMYPPMPGRLRYRITDPGGRLLPARLVVRGRSGTPDPVLGPEHKASGAGTIVCSASGEGEVEIPPGSYRVVATHGLEYSIDRRDVVVEEGRGATVRATLERQVETPGWIAADFHMHAEPSSDSNVPLEDRVVSLVAEGIEFAVATDHNAVTDYGPAARDAGLDGALVTARGDEVTTWRPQIGHFNVWPFPEGAEALPFSGLTPSDLFAIVRERVPEAIISVNHPRMEHNIGYFNLMSLDPATGFPANPAYSSDYDAVEMLNGFDFYHPETISAALADWFGILNLGHRPTAIGGSDAHRLDRQWVGYPRTYVKVSEDRPGAFGIDEVRGAILAGRAIVTTGPFVDMRVEGGGPGDTVPARSGRARLEAEIAAAEWIDVRRCQVVVNGETVAETTITPSPGQTPRAALSLLLPVPIDSWIVVIVRGDGTLGEVAPFYPAWPMAVTNPVFVDADGDGVFTAPGPAAHGSSGPGGPDASTDAGR